jgi:two-component sensor histidine kinase
MTRKKAAAGSLADRCFSQTAESERDAFLTQQTALAKFGELALKADGLDVVLQEGCRLVGAALGTDLSKIMTLEDGSRLFVCAGVGWPDGIVGKLTFPLTEDSSDEYALRSLTPVIATDLSQEKRFKIASFVIDQGVKALVNVPIIGTDHRAPFGILEVDSRVPRQFGDDDIAFLKTYANLIAAAVERHRNLDELRALADQRQRLLHELQHRLKNSLQSMSSLIEMELHQASSEHTESVLQSLLGRIAALRLVHEKIYASGEFDRVELASYIGELFHSQDNLRLKLTFDLRPVTVSPDIAVPLGLIVTEFITNSVKHAFQGDGMIKIRLGPTASGEAQLDIADDGRGLSRAATTGTGMDLIAGLANQIGATSRWEGDHGTMLTLAFPVGSQSPHLSEDSH